jgi:hypothetical protein
MRRFIFIAPFSEAWKREQLMPRIGDLRQSDTFNGGGGAGFLSTLAAQSVNNAHLRGGFSGVRNFPRLSESASLPICRQI